MGNSKDRFSLEAAHNNIPILLFSILKGVVGLAFGIIRIERENKIFFFFKVVYDLFLLQFTRRLGIFWKVLYPIAYPWTIILCL